MAHRIKDPYLTVGGTDLSAHVKSLKPNHGQETHEDRSGPDTFVLYVPGGLKTGVLEVEFYQDFASSQVDATMSAVNGTTASIVWKPNPAAVGLTNPTWTATCLVVYDAGGGDKGAPEMATAKFYPTTDWVRATS